MRHGRKTVTDIADEQTCTEGPHLGKIFKKQHVQPTWKEDSQRTSATEQGG